MELEIIEEYKNYEPPFDVRWYVEKLLDSVDEKYKKKLRYVVLTNKETLSTRRHRQKFKVKGRKTDMKHVLGLYHTLNDKTGSIELFMDDIIPQEEDFVLRFGLIRAHIIGKVLFHELGHHVHANFKPKHEDKEIMADQWQKDFWKNYVRKNHFILKIVVLYPVICMQKALNLIRKR